MTVFWRYLAYRLKKSGLRTLVFILLSVLVIHMVLMSAVSHNTSSTSENFGLSELSTILAIFACSIPILENAELKEKKHADAIYSTPISRGKLAGAHYFSGLIQMFSIYTVNFFYAFFYLKIHTTQLRLFYMLPWYFLSLLLGIILYSFVLFLFNEGNTVLDGVMFCGLESIFFLMRFPKPDGICSFGLSYL